jgi:predicted phage terminase large subunit-like protein
VIQQHKDGTYWKVEEYLNNNSYKVDKKYVPSDFALEFVNFIKLVNGNATENKTPVVHYKMLDSFVSDSKKDVINMCHRGIAKSSIKEYLILYLAVFGELPNFGKVPYALYVSDSIDNGVKKMRKSLEYRWQNSPFLQQYIPEIKFTDIRWEFINSSKTPFVVSGYGARTGVRGPLSLDSKVYTDRGTKTIADVVVGDQIYTPKGTLTTVLGKSEVFHGDMYKLVFDDGRELKCDSTHLHPLYVKTYPNKKTAYVKKLFTTKELLDGAPLIKGTLREYYTAAVEPVQYTEKQLPVQPYLLGLLIAGCIDATKYIPFEYQRGSVKQRRELLAGLLDTDGTCGNQGQVSYCTISKQLVVDVADLARSLGYLVRIGVMHRENRQPIYRAFIRGSVNPFKLSRKAALFKVPNRRSNRVALVAIEAIPNEPSQCIRVEDAEHEFITDNYLATHNTRELGTRPVLALLDDLISDSDARSATVIADVEDTVYKAIDYALHPSRRKVIWSGTPFNAKDPLYKAVESGAWEVNVFPVCEQFPCEEVDFRGSWEDRFDFQYVKRQYEKALLSGKVDTFNQELMLRIMSDDDRMILDSDIGWYKLDSVVKNKSRFNFYITTDFATSVNEKSDFSVISVWAYNNVGDWLWVDGVCKRQLMDKNIDDLFRLAQVYKPQSVGIEVTGQQGGFVSWIQSQMMERNIYFPLASDQNNNAPGIRPVNNKLVRFNTVLPWFKSKKVYFPVEKKNEPILAEGMNELSLISVGGFKSKHDDFIDSVAMLSSLKPWKPSEEAIMKSTDDGMWEIDTPNTEVDRMASYII